MGVPITWQEWHAIAESRGQTIDRLERENAKLRELVRDMWVWQDALPYERHAEIRDRMRELGVEVDE